MLIGALAIAFSRDLSPDAAKIMAEALADIPIERLAAATQRAMRECEHFPMPATLRKLAGEPTTDQIENATAEAAWERVRAHCAALVERERMAASGGEFRLPECEECHGQGWVEVADHRVRRCQCVVRFAAARRALLEFPGGPAGREAKLVKRLGGLDRFRRIVRDGGEEFSFLRRDFIAGWRDAPTVERVERGADRLLPGLRGLGL